MKNAFFAVLVAGFMMTSVSFADDMNKTAPATMDSNKMAAKPDMPADKMDGKMADQSMSKKKHMKKHMDKKDPTTAN